MTQCTAKSKQSGERCKRNVTPGKQVCYYHGGKSLGGIASPVLKTGRHSRYLPKRLLESYSEAVGDSDLLNLHDEVALTDARLSDLLNRVDTGESGEAWQLANSAYTAMQRALNKSDDVAYSVAFADLGQVIKRGLSDYAAWDEVGKLLDQRRRLVESERKLLIDKQMMISVAEVNLYMRVILSALIKSVNEFCDKPTGNRILSSVQDAYSQAAGRSRDLAIIDAGIGSE